MHFDIFIEHDPIDHLSKGIEDLAKYLSKSTSAHVSVKDSPPEDGGAGIWIGKTAAAERFREKIDGLGHDGSLLWGDGSQLVISGKTPDGTTNGIYRFIHRFVGVRWFAPGELFEFVPRLENFELPVVEEVSTPSFDFRMFSGIDSDWCRRNLMDRSRPELPFSNHGHNLTNIFPSSEFARSHPEIYALIDGKRITSQTSHRGQPCFSNPSLVEIAVGKIRDYFDANPNTTTFSLSINDNMDFCECNECAAFGIRSFRGRAIHSNAYFHWVNDVAKEVLKTHRDKYLAALAYWGVILPPQKIEKLPENVVIFLTQDTSQHHDPTYRDQDRSILLEWLGKCSNLVKYDYYGLGWLTPRYFPEIAAKDLDFLKKSNGAGFYCEAYPFWPNIGPQLYMAAQKLWNIKRDHRELLDEFYAFFSPVSEEIEGFYQVLQRSWLRRRPGSWFEGLGNLPQEIKVMSLQDANKARGFLLQAHENSSGNCRKRVEFLKNGFELSYQLIRGFHTSSELRFLPVSEESDIDGALPLLSEIQETIWQAERIHKDRVLPDELYSEVYFKDRRFARKFETWKGMVSSSCLVWLETAFEFLTQKEGGWRELLQKLPRSLLLYAGMVPRLDEVRDLLAGSSLDEIKRPPVKGRRKVRIAQWLLYGRDCRCKIDDSLSHSGKGSIRLESKGRSRLSIYLPVDPGGEYFIGAWGYADRIERKRIPSIDITFLRNLKEEPGEFFSSDVLQTSGEWQRLLLAVRAPKTAELMGVHFAMDNEYERAWIEDVSVRRVR